MTITHYKSSDGRETPLEAMAYTHLANAIAKREREGLDDDMLHALRAERDSRPPPDPNASQPAPRQQAAPPPAGHNKPPADTLDAQLTEDHAGLLSRATDLELAAAQLPKVVVTEEDLAAVNAWIVSARDLSKVSDQTRVRVKEPVLAAQRAIDGFFGGISKNLGARVTTLEQRIRAYIVAKRAREDAERKRLAVEAEALAKAAKEQEDAAAAARKETEDKAARALSELETSQDDETERKAREALAAADDAAAVQSEAAAFAADAQTSAEDAALAASGAYTLPRVEAGGATVSVKRIWVGHIVDPRKLTASMGQIGPHISWPEVEKAVARAAKADPRPAIPGVEFREEDDIKVRGV